MKQRQCLIMALALAGVMFLAGPGWAQNQGGGPGGGPKGNQVCTGGPGGVCVLNPAKSQANQDGPNNPNARMRRGGRGPGPGSRMNQPATPNPAPEASQPSQ